MKKQFIRVLSVFTAITMLLSITSFASIQIPLQTLPATTPTAAFYTSYFDSTARYFQTAAAASNAATAKGGTNEKSYLLLDTDMTDSNSTHFIITSGMTTNNYKTKSVKYPMVSTVNDNVVYSLNNYLNLGTLGTIDNPSFDASFNSYIDKNHVWTTEGSGESGDPYINNWTDTCGINIPSYSELYKYKDYIGPRAKISQPTYMTSGEWVMRSKQANLNNGLQLTYFASAKTISYLSATGVVGSNRYIRPCFFINDQFFLNVKLDIATMGSAVKSMLVSNYPELIESSLYSMSELQTIGFTFVNDETIVAQNPSLDGSSQVGRTLQATYTYSGTNPEGPTKFKWYSCDTSDGTFVEISGANEDSYTISLNLLGKYIKAGITPFDNTGLAYGNEALTDSVLVEENMLVATGVTLTPIYNQVYAGYPLQANYTANAGFNGTAIYQWYYSTIIDGTYLPIDGETNSVFYITNALASTTSTPFYIKVGVKLTEGSETGPELPSDAIKTGGKQDGVYSATSYTLSQILTLQGNTTNTYDQLLTPDPAANLVVLPDGVKYSLLDVSDDEDSMFLLIAGRETNYGTRAYDTSGLTKFDPTASTSIAYYMNDKNGSFYQSFDNTVKPYINENYAWRCSRTPDGQNDYIAVGGLSVLSVSEFRKYYGEAKLATKLSSGKSWYLRDSVNDGGVNKIFSVSVGNSMGGTSITSTEITTRPCFWVGRDFFENVPVNVTQTGASVKNILRTEYSADEIITLYGANDASKILSDEIVTAEDVQITGDAEVGHTVNGDYTYTNDNPNAVESNSRYKWFVSSDNVSYTEIAGATGTTFEITADYLYKYIKFAVSVSDSTGYNLPAWYESQPIGPIKPPAPVSVSYVGTTYTSGSQNFTVTFNYNNITDGDIDVAVIGAAYTTGNEMVYLNLDEDYTCTANTNNGTITITYSIPAGITNIVAMVWDSVDTMHPLLAKRIIQ